MTAPAVYGSAMSTFVRTVRLALEEKPCSYELIDVSPFAGEHRQAEHLARHPFGKVPAFSHDGFDLYETDAIVRYIDQEIPGQSLQPLEAKPRARMNQIIGIVNAYAYRSVIGTIISNRLIVPSRGGQPDEAAIKAAVPEVDLCLKELERLMADNKYLADGRVSLADLFVVPLYHYLALTAEGEALLKQRSKLPGWWDLMKGRNSVATTEPKFG